MPFKFTTLAAPALTLTLGFPATVFAANDIAKMQITSVNPQSVSVVWL